MQFHEDNHIHTNISLFSKGIFQSNIGCNTSMCSTKEKEGKTEQ